MLSDFVGDFFGDFAVNRSRDTGLRSGEGDEDLPSLLGVSFQAIKFLWDPLIAVENADDVLRMRMTLCTATDALRNGDTCWA
jgi:hypothetical protein